MTDRKPSPAPQTASPPGFGLEDVVRRALDILVSGSLLVILMPLMVMVAVLVKFDSPGPVLFRQTRIGRNFRRRRGAAQPVERRAIDQMGRPFVLYKFRTMFSDARERFPHLYTYSYSEEELRTLPIKVLVAEKRGFGNDRSTVRTEAPVSMMIDDPRVTRVGRLLRRTSLDELPNMMNVLKGDMHLVGPRPDITANILYYDERELSILGVKPGITGLAQVKGRGFLTFEQTNAYDLEYLERRSLWLDLQILAWTIPALLKRHGAY